MTNLKARGAHLRLSAAALTSRATLLDKGLPDTTVDRYLKDGHLARTGVEGVYSVPSRPASKLRDMHLAMLKCPTAVLCLSTALYLHGLRTASPPKVWLAIDAHARAPAVGELPVEVVRMSEQALSHGVIEREFDLVSLRFTSLAKAVCDCIKFQGRIGLDVAFEALQLARRVHRVSAQELLECAAVTRVEPAMRHYLGILG